MSKATNRTTCLMISVFLPTILCTTAAGKIIYVDDDADGANNGSSWENAYMYLQYALADANSAEKPVEIRVAQGIYMPDHGAIQTPGDRETTFHLINGVTLKGGYAGLGKLDPNTRDIELYETILSGDLNGNDVQVDDPCDLHSEPSRTENSYHVVIGSWTDETAVINGFTVCAGNATDQPQPYNEYRHIGGGGIYNVSGSPTLNNCAFRGNIAHSGGGMCNLDSNPTITNCTFSGNAVPPVSGVGGGMFNCQSSPIVTDCTFSGNWASFGGGMLNEYNSNPTLIKNIFSGNSVDVKGAGMMNYESAPVLNNCMFHANSADPVHGTGGGMYNGWSNSVLTDCEFCENSAYWAGGGIYNVMTNGLTLTNCTFSRNSSLAGAGMLNEASNPTLNNCVFRGNFAEWAGGMYNLYSNPALNNSTFSGNFSERGGGMFNFASSNPTLTNCAFSGNSARWDGGGMWNVLKSAPTLSNCVFAGNSAHYGGGMKNSQSRPTMINCTFAQNSAQYGNALSCDYYMWQEAGSSNVVLINCILWDGGNEVWNNEASTITISYNDIQGGQASVYDPYGTVIWGEGNINAEPLFASEGYWDLNNTPDDPNDDFWVDGDYHLKSEAGRWDPTSESWVIEDVTSPCINAGDPNNSVGDEPEPNGGIINMGAYGGTEKASKSP